jgi:anti-anti-sigma factor
MHTSRPDVLVHRIPVVELQATAELCDPILSDFEAAVTEVLAVRPGMLIIDLSRCPRIDAAGVAMLMNLHRLMRRDGGRLCVRAPAPQIRRVLQIARVDQILDIIPAGSTAAVASEGERP